MKELKTPQELKDMLAQNENVVVDVSALSWCQPCKMMKPIFDYMSEIYQENVQTVLVDVDTNGEAVAEYGVRAVPTFLFFKNGELVERITGMQPKQTIKAAYEKLLSYVDYQEVSNEQSTNTEQTETEN